MLRGSLLAQLVSACLLLLSVSACSGVDEATWTEQVQLHDGRMIEVWRRATRHSNGFPNAKRGGYIESEIRYEPMGVRWQGSSVTRLVSFDLIDDVPYLLFHLPDRADCTVHSPTQLAIRILKWQKGAWVEVPQSEFPIDLPLMNLYRGYWGHSTADDAKGLITWQEKGFRDSFYPDKPEKVSEWHRKINWYCTKL